MNSLRQHKAIVDVLEPAWDEEGENSQNEENNQLNWPMWCNQDNSAHVHLITNHRQHRTSKKLLTQKTKILLFLLLIISLIQHNHLYLHFDTRSQNNKTQSTMSDLLLFFFLRDIHSSHYSSIEYHSTPTTTTKYVLSLNSISTLLFE